MCFALLSFIPDKESLDSSGQRELWPPHFASCANMSDSKACVPGDITLSLERIKSGLSNILAYGRTKNEELLDLAIFYNLIPDPSNAQLHWIHVPDMGQLLFVQGIFHEPGQSDNGTDSSTSGDNKEIAGAASAESPGKVPIPRLKSVGPKTGQNRAKRAATKEEYLDYRQKAKNHSYPPEKAQRLMHLTPILPPHLPTFSGNDEVGRGNSSLASAVDIKDDDATVTDEDMDGDKVIEATCADEADNDADDELDFAQPQVEGLGSLPTYEQAGGRESFDEAFGGIIREHTYGSGIDNDGSSRVAVENDTIANQDSKFNNLEGHNGRRFPFDHQQEISFDTVSSSYPHGTNEDDIFGQPAASNFPTSFNEPTLPQSHLPTYPDLDDDFPTGNEPYLTSEGPYYTSSLEYYNTDNYYIDPSVFNTLPAPTPARNQALSHLHASSFTPGSSFGNTTTAINNDNHDRITFAPSPFPRLESPIHMHLHTELSPFPGEFLGRSTRPDTNIADPLATTMTLSDHGSLQDPFPVAPGLFDMDADVGAHGPGGVDASRFSESPALVGKRAREMMHGEDGGGHDDGADAEDGHGGKKVRFEDYEDEVDSFASD